MRAVKKCVPNGNLKHSVSTCIMRTLTVNARNTSPTVYFTNIQEMHGRQMGNGSVVEIIDVIGSDVWWLVRCSCSVLPRSNIHNESCPANDSRATAQ